MGAPASLVILGITPAIRALLLFYDRPHTALTLVAVSWAITSILGETSKLSRSHPPPAPATAAAGILSGHDTDVVSHHVCRR